MTWLQQVKWCTIFLGDDWEKAMPIPYCIDDYDHHMGGVDIADQLGSYYDTQFASFRTGSQWFLDT